MESREGQSGIQGITASRTEIYQGRIEFSNEVELCVPPESMEMEVGASYVVSTRYGEDIVEIFAPAEDLRGVKEGDLKSVLRRVGKGDLGKRASLELREKEAFQVCKEKINYYGLDMNLVVAHYLLDESKVLFLFTAEQRVDFRELVKDLVGSFRTRIELRQVGVRDEARMVGGLGVCGRELCCHSVTDRLKPVTIKMVKEQGLSMNSTKISGHCDRLLCCLAYEYDYYHSEKKKFPKEGTKIHWDGESFRVTEVNIFSGRLKLLGREGRYLNLSSTEFFYDKKSGVWRINPH